MKAFLLAAGSGTRLSPLTKILPKCLMPINGVPLLDYWIEYLLNAGIEHIFINYQEKIVPNYYASYTHKNKLTFIYEDELLLTGGSVKANYYLYKNDGALMIVHADNLCIFDWQKFIKAYYNSINTKITLLSFKSDQPQSCGILQLEDNLVTAIYEKSKNPPGNIANGAVYIFASDALAALDTLKEKKFELIDIIINNYLGNILAVENNIYHRDIGNISSYRQARSDFKISFEHHYSISALGDLSIISNKIEEIEAIIHNKD